MLLLAYAEVHQLAKIKMLGQHDVRQRVFFFLNLWQELDHIRSRKLELTKSLHVVVSIDR